MNHDAECVEAIQRHVNLTIPWILMAAFLYYHRDVNILSDETYDAICAAAKVNREGINHPHKAVLPASWWGSSTGSLCDLRERDYPIRTRSAALSLCA